MKKDYHLYFLADRFSYKMMGVLQQRLQPNHTCIDTNLVAKHNGSLCKNLWLTLTTESRQTSEMCIIHQLLTAWKQLPKSNKKVAATVFYAF